MKFIVKNNKKKNKKKSKINKFLKELFNNSYIIEVGKNNSYSLWNDFF